MNQDDWDNFENNQEEIQVVAIKPIFQVSSGPFAVSRQLNYHIKTDRIVPL